MTKRISLSALYNHKIFIYFIRIAAWMTFFIISYIGLSNENLWYDCPALSLTCVLSTCFVDFKIDYANMSPLKNSILFMLKWTVLILGAFLIYKTASYFPFKL